MHISAFSTQTCKVAIAAPSAGAGPRWQRRHGAGRGGECRALSAGGLPAGPADLVQRRCCAGKRLLQDTSAAHPDVQLCGCCLTARASMVSHCCTLAMPFFLQDDLIGFRVGIPLDGDIVIALWFGDIVRETDTPAFVYAFHTAFVGSGLSYAADYTIAHRCMCTCYFTVNKLT
jgi:hypothetical protein